MKETVDYSKLINDSLNGDDSAFEELYQLTHKTAYHTASLLLKTSNDIEDVLQNSYIKAYQKLSEIKNPESFESWVKSIVENECKNYIKKEKRISAPIIFFKNKADENSEEWKQSVPQEYMEREELQKSVSAIIDKLSPEVRACIILFHYEEKSLNEISEILDIPLGTVKSRLHNGRKQIENEFNKLRKKDPTLYGIGAIPVIISLLSYQAKNVSVPAAISEGIITSVSNTASATGAASSAAGTAVATSSVAATSGAATTIAVKVTAVAVAGSVAIGGTVAVKNHIENKAVNNTTTSYYSTTALPETCTTSETSTEASSQIESKALITTTSLSTTKKTTTSTAQNTTISSTSRVSTSAKQATTEPTSKSTSTTSVTTSKTTSTTKLTTTITSTTKETITETTTKKTTTTTQTTTEETTTKKSTTTTTDPPTTAPESNYGTSSGVITEYTGSDSAISIPATIGSETVTAIGAGAFAGNTDIESVNLPSSVTQIGQEAFADCSSLSSISLPSSLELIGIGAFYGCTTLTSVTVPDGTKTISDEAFAQCTSLSTITIPSSVTSISDDAFDGCDSLTIRCEEGSAAHDFAVANNINFSLV